MTTKLSYDPAEVLRNEEAVGTRHDTTDVATLEPWMLATLNEIGAQRDRLMAGIACKDCRGAGNVATKCERLGLQYHICGVCDGSGVRVKNY